MFNSLALTLPNSIKKSTTSLFVSTIGMISNNLKYLAGLKKCVPIKLFGFLKLEASDVTDSDEVLLVKIVSSVIILLILD